MSIYSDDYETRREQRREEERQYRADVTYDVWRSGRNPDRVDYERVQDHFYRGDGADEAAAHECRLQRQAEDRRREEREQEDEQMRQEEQRCHDEQEAEQASEANVTLQGSPEAQRKEIP